jgi:ketosteroid isomerase-like protein
MSENHRALIEKFISLYNAKEVGAMIELFTEDAVFESVSNTDGVTRAANREELRQLAMMGAEFFEERRQTPINWVLGEDRGAVEIDYWCRLAKDLPNGARAGEEMRLRGASFFTFREERICRLVDYM